jgi:hypothetical protein
MTWDPPTIDTDEDSVTDRILDGLAARLPGWEPVEGAPEVALAEELGREVAVLGQTAVLALDLAVAGLAQTGFNFPAFEGIPATIPVTLTLTAAGAVIPAGFTVVGLNSGGEEVAFVLAADTGATSTTVTVTMTASEAGVIGNGVPAGDLTVVTATTFVASATATAASSGGVDPESLDAFLTRFAEYASTLRPGGVRADDLAALAESVTGVGRALGVDLWDAALGTGSHERTASVFLVDSTGHACSAGVKTTVQAVLEAAREVNFVIRVANPNYQRVQIVYAAIAETGSSTTTVKAAIDAALGTWLAQWGSSTADPQAWADTTTVRILDAVRVIAAVPGVAALTSLTINGGTVDVTLTGPAAYPTPLDAGTSPSTITGTVS